MIPEEQQQLASLYAAGALPPEEQRAFEVTLRCDAELAELVRSLQRAADLMALAAPRMDPPRELREKGLSRIRAATEAPAAGPSIKTERALRPGFHFHGAADPSGWKQLPLRGAWVKLLALEKDRGYAILLGKLEAGVRYPAHGHLGAEELYILTGDLHIGDRSLGPGDFHHSDAGTAHDVNYSVEGCTLLAVLPAKHELVQFALAGDS